MLLGALDLIGMLIYAQCACEILLCFCCVCPCNVLGLRATMLVHVDVPFVVDQCSVIVNATAQNPFHNMYAFYISCALLASRATANELLIYEFQILARYK